MNEAGGGGSPTRSTRSIFVRQCAQMAAKEEEILPAEKAPHPREMALRGRSLDVSDPLYCTTTRRSARPRPTPSTTAQDDQSTVHAPATHAAAWPSARGGEQRTPDRLPTGSSGSELSASARAAGGSSRRRGGSRRRTGSFRAFCHCSRGSTPSSADLVGGALRAHRPAPGLSRLLRGRSLLARLRSRGAPDGRDERDGRRWRRARPGQSALRHHTNPLEELAAC